MRIRLGMLVALLGAARASAQQITGVVRDSAQATPVPGAVVSLFDSAGHPLSRAITNERGEYKIAWFLQGQTMRVQRIGYRPANVPWSARETVHDFTLARFPMMLLPVDVRAAAKCPERRDRYAALSLLQQTRSALLNMIVARDMNPATSMLRIVYRREMKGNSDEIAHQSVHVYRGNDERESFFSAHSAGEFVDSGFVNHTPQGVYFHGPDADVLLDERFESGYCFRLADGDREYPGRVGLVFEPATRRKDRVDLDGTVWIDTIARALVRIDYAYVGLTLPRGAIQPHGTTSFHEMRNGVVFVDRWSIRTFGRVADTVWRYGTSLHDASAVDRVGRATYFTRETGGEVDDATWSDGAVWHTALGTLRMRLTKDGAPLRNAWFSLDDTDYSGISDSTGIVTIPHLLPGPYDGVFTDTVFDHPTVTVSSPVRFSAARNDTAWRTIAIPAASTFLRKACVQPVPPPVWGLATIGTITGLSKNPKDWKTLIRVEDPRGTPTRGASIELRYSLGSNLTATEFNTTGAGGLVRPCMDMRPHSTVRVNAHLGAAVSDDDLFTVLGGEDHTYIMHLRPPQ